MHAISARFKRLKSLMSEDRAKILIYAHLVAPNCFKGSAPRLVAHLFKNPLTKFLRKLSV
jgi:hypothetical protein